MAAPMTPLTVNRLAFVRFLYDQGVTQAKQADPLSATAILSFHDAVEQFLRLAGDHLGISFSKNVPFAGYWTEIRPGLPQNAVLPNKGAMSRLNDARVALKHHGTLPSRHTIDQAQADTATFFADATPLVFGVDFHRVDMIDLVTRTETAQTLREAQTHADGGDLPMAMVGLMLAFTEMVDYYAGRRPTNTGHPFQFGPRIKELGRGRRLDALSGHLEMLGEATRALQKGMRITSLGIDYSKYAQFEVLCPPLAGRSQEGWHFTQSEAHKQQLTQDDFEFGRQFVIGAALQAAGADAVLKIRSDQSAVNNPEPGFWHSGTNRVWTGPVGG